MDHAQIGQKGEAAAAQYYLNRGCVLLAHDYRTRMGELDLVLQQENTIVICEVKTRSPGSRLRPAAAVDSHKQKRLILAARRYLQQAGYTDRPVRFDVAEVVPLASGIWQVHCIRNAFDAFR